MSEFVEDNFVVNFSVDAEVAADPTLLKGYAMQCRETWVEQLEMIGGKMEPNTLVSAGLVKIAPDEPSPGTATVEPVQFVQVSGEAWLPVPDPRYAEGALETAIVERVFKELSFWGVIRDGELVDRDTRTIVTHALKAAVGEVITEYRG